MNGNSPIKTIFATILVVVFGWGSGYIVIQGLQYVQSSTTTTKIDDQRAVTLEAFVNNPKVPGSSTSTSTVQKITYNIPLRTQNSDSTTGNKLKILVGGDIMFDREIRAIGDRNGYDSLFSDSIRTLFKKADIVIVNLEGPITDNISKTLVGGKTTDSFTFTFSPITAQTLKDAGITIVSLANNHVDNFGFTGYQETQKYLKSAGLEWFGNPWNSTSTRLTLRNISENMPDSPIVTILEKNGIKIAFVGYHAFQTGIDKVVAEIKRVSSPDVFTIVMPHWGEEYVTIPSDKMRSYAHAFITAGADAVIGAHPHVVAEQEWVDAIPVYYSIGNLLFDQYFSVDTKQGLIIELNLVQHDSNIFLDHLTTHDAYIKPGVGVSLEK